MSKGSGNTRASSSSSPSATALSSKAMESSERSTGRLPKEEYEAAENELYSQIEEISNRSRDLMVDMMLDPKNKDYYEGQIAENDKIVDELEAELSNLRERQRGRMVTRKIGNK